MVHLLETNAFFWQGVRGRGGSMWPGEWGALPSCSAHADCLKKRQLVPGGERIQSPRRGGPGSPPSHGISQRAACRAYGVPRQGRCRVQPGTPTRQPPKSCRVPLPSALAPRTSWGTGVSLNLLLGQSDTDVGTGLDLDASNPRRDVAAYPGPRDAPLAASHRTVMARRSTHHFFS